MPTIYGYECEVGYTDPGDRLRKDVRVRIVSQRALPVAFVVNAMKQKAAGILKTWRLDTPLRGTPTASLNLTVDVCTETITG
jgi:hypothetical protein